MPQLPLKLKGLTMGLCMAITMSISMSAIILIQNQGLTEEFADLWLHNTITALPFSVVIGVTFSTLYSKIFDRFLFKPQ